MDCFNAKCSTKETRVGVLDVEAFSPKTRDQNEAIHVMEN
jgi:hypothetical protein